MDGGDRHVFDTHRLIQQFEQRHTTVGGAGGVGHQLLGAAQAILIDPVDHRGVDICLTGHRLRQQYARRASIDKALRLAAAGVLAGAFEQQIDIKCGPVDGFRAGLAQHFYAVAIDMQTIAVDLHLTGKTSVGGVEAGQVFNAGLVGQVVQRDDFQLCPGAPLMQRTQHAAADTAITVEGNSIGALGHGGLDREP